MTTLIDNFFGQGSRATDGGASGSEAFTLLLRLLVTHLDWVNTGEGYTKLHAFGVCDGTSFSDLSREFRVLVSPVTGSERALSPGTDVVLDVVRMAINEQFPTLILTLYPGIKATDPRPYASLDAPCGNILVTWRTIRHPPSTAKNISLYLFLQLERGHPLLRGPGPPFMDTARAECRLSCLLGRRDQALIRK